MFLHPLGLLAFLAVPAVVALHLYRRRFQPHAVSAVFLWTARDRLSVAGRRREPLRRSPSFWCETLAALLAALAFAGPRFLGAGEARHLVVVLDDSASMSAVAVEAATGKRLGVSARARAEVERRVAGLPRGSRVTLVRSGTRPRLLAGPAAFPAEARAALADWTPSAPRHDIAPALALASQLAGQGALLLVTDHFRPEDWPEEVEVLALGQPLDNVAIVHSSRRRLGGEGELGERVDLTLANLGETDRSVTVVAGSELGELDRSRVDIGAGERFQLQFRLPQDTPRVEVRIDEDALTVDDAVWLVPVPPRTLALASELAPELDLQLGLDDPRLPGSTIERWLALVPDSVEAPAGTPAHLRMTRGTPSDASAADPGWCLAFVAEGERRTPWIGPFLIDRRHPLLEGVTLDGVVWNASGRATLPGAPLVSAGNQPLLSEELLDGRRVYHLDLDPSGSTLQRSPDWPILLANLAELRRRELPGPERTNLQLGESFRYHGRATSRLSFEGPETSIEVAGRATLEIESVERTGVYTLSDESGVLCEVAYGFADAAESDLRAAGAGRREGVAAAASLASDFGWPERLLLGTVLALLALDWWFLERVRRAPPRAGPVRGRTA